MSLNQLSATTVARLNAGQVAGDAVAVLKDLLENALDAGATVVEVRTEEAGLRLLEVSDNGAGLSPAQLEECALGGRTSKLATLADLATLGTYGFRGQALRAAAQAGELELWSGPWHARYTPAGTAALEPAPARPGTTARVSSLFTRLPVRRQGLAARRAGEGRRLEQLVLEYALARPDVTLSYARHSYTGPVPARLAEAYGPLVAAQLAEVATPLGVLWVPAAGPTGQALFRSRPDRRFVFVNRRPVDVPLLARAITRTVRLAFPAARLPHPLVVARLTLPPDTYDINVSPDKRQILLHEPEAAAAAMVAALRAHYGLADILPYTQPRDGRESLGEEPDPAAEGEGPDPAAEGEGPDPAAEGEGPDPAAEGEGPDPAAEGEEVGADELEAVPEVRPSRSRQRPGEGQAKQGVAAVKSSEYGDGDLEEGEDGTATGLELGSYRHPAPAIPAAAKASPAPGTARRKRTLQDFYRSLAAPAAPAKVAHIELSSPSSSPPSYHGLSGELGLSAGDGVRFDVAMARRRLAGADGGEAGPGEALAPARAAGVAAAVIGPWADGLVCRAGRRLLYVRPAAAARARHLHARMAAPAARVPAALEVPELAELWPAGPSAAQAHALAHAGYEVAGTRVLAVPAHHPTAAHCLAYARQVAAHPAALVRSRLEVAEWGEESAPPLPPHFTLPPDDCWPPLPAAALEFWLLPP